MTPADYTRMTGREIRSLCRENRFDRPTAGVACGYAQANLVVLRSSDAADFERFCRLNPGPCPLLEVTEPGHYEPTAMAPGADVRTDLSRYRVFREGVCIDQPDSIESYWHDDSVTFLIGCSFTFEFALLAAGVPVRHIEEGRNVPMYQSTVPCAPVGRFQTDMIVSMRPMTPANAKTAARISAAFPLVHGPPIHVGDPSAIGITDLARPEYGDAVTIRTGEVPVFWACGVTPMAALMAAKPDLAITHEPGHMFVTDVRDESLREQAGDS